VVVVAAVAVVAEAAPHHTFPVVFRMPPFVGLAELGTLVAAGSCSRS